jgi:putative peptidoglycan binding protein
MSNANIQKHLIRLRLLDPPADGQWGQQSKQSLKDFQAIVGLKPTGELDQATIKSLEVCQLSLKLGEDLASQVVRYMLAQGYFVSAGDRRYNIVYIEGADKNGKPNNDAFNEWNDRRIIIEVSQGTPRIIGNWLATTEPGSTYTYHPMNPGGCFRIAFGQYKAWQFGRHGRTQYPALVQCAEISGYRDRNEDGSRTGDLFVTGDNFGVNQHHGWDMAFIDNASAGCLVGQSIEDHKKFMDVLRTDKRYQANNSYIFYTTVIAGDRLWTIS